MNPMYMVRIKDNLIKSLDNNKVYKFLHVPVQSGSNSVLNDMKRGHTAETFRDIVQKVRKQFPEFTISTDIIVGFPTETKEDFEKTVQLIKDTKPDIVNLSRYSARPGTEAAELDQIDVFEVKRRSKIIFDLTNQISNQSNKKWIGWKGKVLFNENTDEGIKGRNFAYKSIFVDQDVKLGQEHLVEIVDATNHSLIGRIAG